MIHEIGDLVTYIPFEGCSEELYQNGKVKSIGSDGHYFVVFHCNNEWDNYADYTGQLTDGKQLIKGWIDERIEI